jgi:hypothetical protein
MKLIDRYIHEVGRHLPRKNRADIQIELRSLLVDDLEDRAGPNPSEDQVVELLKEYGPPRTVAASYHPEGQYLIGPELYPLFKMVTVIALAAVLGSQLLAWGIALLNGHGAFSPLQALGGLLTAIPSALGMIVIVFALLQRFEVRPDTDEKAWDPMSLPKVDEVEHVKRGERIAGIIVQIAVLVLLTFFPQWIGFMTFPGGEFFANPVIQDYVVLISVSILISLSLDIYLLWQGRWVLSTRIARIAVNLLAITVLLLLIQGHTAWLVENGAGGLFDALMSIPTSAEASWQVIGMASFRLAFGIAAIVTVFETLVIVFRMVRRFYRKGSATIALPTSKS